MTGLKNWVANISIKYKLVGILLFSLCGMVYFSGINISAKSGIVDEMEFNQELRDLAITTSELVHELQKERGATAGFVGSKGAKMGTELASQRVSTDGKADAMKAFLKEVDVGEDLGPIISEAIGKLDQIQSKRQAVNSLSIKLGDALGYYTGMNKSFLNIIAVMPQLIMDGEVANHFTGYYALQLLKEPMGIERAVLSGTFAADRFAPKMHRKLIELVKAQSIANDLYMASMPIDDQNALVNGLKGKVLDETNRMRDLAFEKAEEGGFGIEPGYWFKMQTEKINLLNDNVVKGHLQKEMTKITTIRMGEAKSALMRTWVIAVIAFAVSCLVAYYISHGITSSVGETVDAVSKIGAGDFTQSVRVQGRDEIGILGNQINSMVTDLRNMFVSIAGNSQTLSVSAEELSGVSSQLASGSQEMTVQANTVASATEEMSANINSMASAVEEASVNSSSVSSTAEQMSANMRTIASAIEEMTVSINDVAKNAQDTAHVAGQATELSGSATKTMHTLGTSANEIGKVTEMIKRIAEQTNLLALNATIEAASAGDAGKGFAVVANEIKELANQSGQAAEDITDKISGVQSSTNEAVQVISDVADIIAKINESVQVITRSVNEQTKAANEIASNVNEVTNGANNIASAISEVAKGTGDISKNAGEAAKGTSEVSSNIQGINRAVSESNDGIQRINTSSNDLTRVAKELKDMVGKFKTAANGDGNTAIRQITTAS